MHQERRNIYHCDSNCLCFWHYCVVSGRLANGKLVHLVVTLYDVILGEHARYFAHK